MRRVFVFAALLAIFLQAFTLQTHVHGFAVGVATAYAEADIGDGHPATDLVHVSTAHHQNLCTVCPALPTSVRAALPDAPTIATRTNATYEAAALEIRRAPRALTHSWQSRAPPIAL